MPQQTFTVKSVQKFKTATPKGKHLYREIAELATDPNADDKDPSRSTVSISITDEDAEPVFSEGASYTLDLRPVKKSAAKEIADETK